jgi:hypothetical protein
MAQTATERQNDQSHYHLPENEEIGVVVGLPARGRVRIEWAIMFRSLQAPVNGSMVTKTVLNAPIAQAREAVADWAVEQNCRYLFFVDDDVLMPNNSVRRLVYQMDNNPDWDLISGIYVTKTNVNAVPPDVHEPLIFGGKPGSPHAFFDWKLDDIFPIWGCGMGCAMIRVETLKNLPKPWFAEGATVDGMDSREIGEDLYFCEKLRENGGTLMADGGLLCGHIDNEGAVHALDLDAAPIQNASPEVLKRYKLYEQKLEEKGKKPKAMAGIAGS